MKKIKVLMLNYEFPPLGGGCGVACESLLNKFTGSPEVEIDLIASSGNDFALNELSPNVWVHLLDIGKNNKNLLFQSQKDLLKFSFKAFFYARKLISQKQYDLIHAFFGVPCGFIAGLLGLPYIVSLRGSDVPFHNPRFYWQDKLIFSSLSKSIWRKARLVIANSPGLKEDAEKFFPQKEIGLITNAIDTEEFSPREKSSKDEVLRFIFTGRLSEVKGLNYLIEACHVVAKRSLKNFELWVLGDGKLMPELQKQASEGAARDKIKFLGAIEHKKVVSFLRQCDCFLMPSLNEGMPMALLEAMSCGLAVACSDIPALSAWVNKEDNGFLFQAASASHLADAMEKVLDLEKEALDEFKKRSREKVLPLDWEKAKDKYLNIYQEI